MLADYLKGNIHFAKSAATWQDAIRQSAQPLLDKNYITSNYVDAIIENVDTNGPYIIILPEIAIPHARNEYGALKTGITFLLLEEPVLFPGEKPVKILMALSAESNDGHLELLGELGSILIDEDVVAALKIAKSEVEVVAIIEAADE